MKRSLVMLGLWPACLFINYNFCCEEGALVYYAELLVLLAAGLALNLALALSQWRRVARERATQARSAGYRIAATSLFVGMGAALLGVEYLYFTARFVVRFGRSILTAGIPYACMMATIGVTLALSAAELWPLRPRAPESGARG